MLVQFSVTNHLSFKGTATLDMRCARGLKSLKDTNVISLNIKAPLLASAVIFGPNASGKSNFYFSLYMLSQLVERSAGLASKTLLPYHPFGLEVESSNAPTKYEIEYIVDGHVAKYSIEYNAERILEETLVWFPSGRPIKLIQRKWDNGTYQTVVHSKIGHKSERDLIVKTCHQRTLLLSQGSHLNNELLKKFADWFEKNLITKIPEGFEEGFNLLKDIDYKDKLVQILKFADYTVAGLEVEKKPVSEETNRRWKRVLAALADDDEDDTYKKALADGPPEDVEPKLIHAAGSGNSIALNWAMESGGTQFWFKLAAPLIKLLHSGGVLWLNEMSSLHPLLVRELLGLFNNPRTNPHGAQLVFNTHDLTLLDQNILRRDQIHFTERNNKGESLLFSLNDFENRNSKSILKGYLEEGRYGALPVFPNV